MKIRERENLHIPSIFDIESTMERIRSISITLCKSSSIDDLRSVSLERMNMYQEDEMPPRRETAPFERVHERNAGRCFALLSPSFSPFVSSPPLPSPRSFSRVYARTCFIAPSLGHISVTPVLVNQRRMPSPSLSLDLPPSLSVPRETLFLGAFIPSFFVRA